MNIRLVVNQFGLLLVVFGGIMFALAGAFFLVEGALRHPYVAEARNSLLMGSAVGLLTGGSLWFITGWIGRRPGAGSLTKHMGRREALLLVAMSWVVGAAFAGLPFFLWAHLAGEVDHPFYRPVNCYFEAMSGLTTTGATVLDNIPSVPRSLLLWRAMTHWLGGLGIVVLFVAVLPSLGVGGKRLYQVEAPGPAPEGLQPQIRDTARVLWFIYFGLTVIEVLALMLAGMDVFDAICHTFATLATGGFSTKNASVGAYGPAVQWVIIFFMVLAGMNFGLFYQLCRRKFRQVLLDPELRLYLVLLIVGSAIVFLTIAREPLTLTTGRELMPPHGAGLRQAVFTTVSISTTTGFCSSDFNKWPFVAKAVLVVLMFIGACSGSTAGGIKVIRLWIAAKVMVAEVERVFRPNVIRPVRLAGGAVDDALKLSTLAFVLGMIVIFALGAGLVMAFEQWFNPDAHCSFASAASASIATLCTIGPGLDQVGAVEHYGWFSTPSKIVLSMLMALGRLELFAIIVLFSRRFWRTQ